MSLSLSQSEVPLFPKPAFPSFQMLPSNKPLTPIQCLLTRGPKLTYLLPQGDPRNQAMEFWEMRSLTHQAVNAASHPVVCEG